MLSLERDRSIADETLAAGAALDSATSSGSREAAYEQESVNLQRDREELADGITANERDASDPVSAPQLKQVAALTWQTDSELAPQDLIRAAAQIESTGGVFLIHKQEYLATAEIMKSHRKFSEALEALQGAPEPNSQTFKLAHDAGWSFSSLVAALGVPRTAPGLNLLKGPEFLPPDPSIRSSFLNAFAQGVHSRRTEQEDIYPGSPESIKGDAERKEFIRAMQQRLSCEFESTTVSARLEPDSRTVKVEEKQTGTERRSTVETNGAATTARTQPRTKSEEMSMAHAITTDALGHSARTVEAFIDAGTYRGLVLGETERYLIQRQSVGMAVVHEKNLLDSQPQVGESFSINYSNGRGVVREFHDRAKSNELSR